ncbi:MAG: glycosyltransferase family 2 protein, partial [Crenarchaeota archaeon]|nr:glycosyltransferase family 2 protein [Thermoproteota archaeon]
MVKKPISQVELSFVIPACDEEGLIEAVLDTVDAVARNGRLRYEIVVVDDGSRDLTFEKATAYAKRNSHVKVLSYAANMGKGYALKTGFMQAAGVLVVFADGDCEVDLHTIWRYLAALEHGDIVIASKRHPDSHVEVPLARK